MHAKPKLGTQEVKTVWSSGGEDTFFRGGHCPLWPPLGGTPVREQEQEKEVVENGDPTKQENSCFVLFLVFLD